MSKIIKYIFSSIFLLFFIFFIYLNFFFNLNNYKNEIENLISEKINYNFKYNGHIEVSYKSSLNAIIPNIEISDIKTKEIIVKIQKLDTDIDFSDFLNDKITINYIVASNVKYYGVDIDNTIIETYSILKNQQYPNTKKRQKNFTNILNIRGTGNINQTILVVDDIDLETTLIKGTSSGEINLINKNANIRITSMLKEDEVTKKRYANDYPDDLVGEIVPIIISGKLDNPKVNVDIKLLIKKKIVEPLQEKAKEILKKTIEEKIKIELPF